MAPSARSASHYGTPPGHIESRDERFLIDCDRGDDSVWYDILHFSRPSQLFSQLGDPEVRRMQKQFGRVSAVSMLC